VRSNKVKVNKCERMSTFFIMLKAAAFVTKSIPISYPSVRADSIGMNSKKGFFSMNSRNINVVNVLNR